MPRPGPRPFECVRRSWHSDRHQPIRGSIIQQIFRVVDENHNVATKKNREWQEKLPVVVFKSEEILYSKANSEAEYLDPETLWDRLNDAIDTIIRKDETMEIGEFLPPCVEAALNLGCVPVRSSRSQRNSNTRSYLSPRNQEPAPNPPQLDGANQTQTRTHTFSDSNKDMRQVFKAAPSFYPQNIPRQMMSFENRPSSVYQLFNGFHFQPQMGFHTHTHTHTHTSQPNPNSIIIGTPVFQTTHESLPSSSHTGCPERLFLFDKDDSGGSNKECRVSRPAELVECDLSLRLGLVPSHGNGSGGAHVVDLTGPGHGPGQDHGLGPRSKEFSFFPLNSAWNGRNSEAEEVSNRVMGVGKRPSFLQFDAISEHERMKRRGL